LDPTVAALASVHGCIGAVDPLRTFGSAEQKARLLPLLASGERISGFALTEPAAGSDLTALRTTAELKGDHYEVNGEKLFITDALVAWGSWLIDQGYRGELECIIAKIFGSEAQKEAAIELFMKTHGGRSFLHGHMFGDSVHEYLAPCIYEGEGEMLGMAFFKSLVKEHGRRFFEPIGKKLQERGIKSFKPYHPRHLWVLRRELGAYSRWSLGRKLLWRDRQSLPGMNPRLAEHVSFA